MPSVARAAVLLGSAALLLVGPTVAVTQAQPAPLPIELAEAVQRDLHLSPEQYLAQSDLAQQVGAFGASARDRFPDSFAGSWLDDHGTAIVALAPGADNEAARRAVADAGFTVRDVTTSQAALQNRLNAFGDWLRGQPADVAKLIQGAAVDLLNNTLAIRVHQVAGGVPLPSFLDPIAPRVLVTPPVVGGDPGRRSAAETIDTAPTDALPSGSAYVSIAGDSSLRCSLGFNGTDSAGRAVNITAGHCDPNLPTAGTPAATEVRELRRMDTVGPRIGTFRKSVLGKHDYAVIGVDDAERGRFENNLVRVPGQAPVAVDGIASPVVGAPVCKSGARTGFSCGKINAVDQSVQVGDRTLDDAFSTTLCALPGDSGGGIITGTKAVGVTSASSVADSPVCAIPEFLGSITGDTPVLFATTLNVVLAENPDLKVRTS